VKKRKPLPSLRLILNGISVCEEKEALTSSPSEFERKFRRQKKEALSPSPSNFPGPSSLFERKFRKAFLLEVL
jgi:hypothetical protein